MTRIRTRILVLVFALAAVAGLAGLPARAGTAAADGIAGVNCALVSPGVSDCTITLGTAIAPGGSLFGTLSAAGTIVGCTNFSAGAACNFTPATVVFTCPAGCPAGSTYRDAVQGSFVPTAQTFSPTSGSGCLVGALGGLQTCAYQSGCVVQTLAGPENFCGGYSVAGTSSCLSSVSYTLANLCTTGFVNGTPCTALTSYGFPVNTCGLGVNCLSTIYTVAGPVERTIC